MKTLWLVLSLVMLTSIASAQEYLDTAGRWRLLRLPGGEFGSGFVPRCIAANNGRVLIGRESRSLLMSRDSGDSWTAVDNALPAGIANIWALGFPDPAAAPLRVVGLVSASSSSAPNAQIVESTDGGTTWKSIARLAEMDTLLAASVDSMRLFGPPTFTFATRTDGGRIGFLYSAAGLFATTDGGATWNRRGARQALRALAMADELHGVGVVAAYRSTRGFGTVPGGVCWTADGGETWTENYSFPDAGFFQYITMIAYSPTVFRALIPERFQNYMDWRLLRTSDGGRTWGDYRGRQARRPLYGQAFFRDTTDVHIVCDGAILSHSADAGESFYVLKDTVRYWWQTPLDDIPGFLAKAPVSTTDNRYIYMTVPGNRAARWRMAAVEPLSGVDQRTSGPSGVLVFPNPVSGGRIHVRIPGEGTWRLEIWSIVGTLLSSQDVVPTGAWSDVSVAGMLPGQYVLQLRRNGHVTRVPFIVR